jgi:uncharacterized membrane protein
MKMDLAVLGVIVIFIGMLMVFIGVFSAANSGNAKVAVGGFIGFIPFGFANDRRMLWLVVGISFFALALFLIASIAGR